jgi:hypothetical protein
MSRTIEAIMRHMAPPASRATHQSNRVEKLEKEITVKKRHYISAESSFMRTMLPFHPVCESATMATKSTAKAYSI